MELNRVNCRNILNDEFVFEKLRSYKFDIAITEAFDMCGYGIFHVLNIPQHFTASSVFIPDRLMQNIGAPTAPSYVPSNVVKFADRMSFLERFSNVIASLVGYGLGDWIGSGQDYIFHEKYGKEFPTMHELMLNSTFFFSNTDPLVDFPRPTIHQVVDIGGIAVPKRSTERLNEVWQSVLSLRPKTILVSFGSAVKAHTMPQSFKEGLLQAMRRFPDITFIWKYEYPEHNLGVSLRDATEDGDNVVTVEWVPQTDLLSDSRLSGFLTHGGMGSTNEATVRGVPMVLIPVMVDQFRNARMIERIGNGIVFEKKDLENPDMVQAIIERLLNRPNTARKGEGSGSDAREQTVFRRGDSCEIYGICHQIRPIPPIGSICERIGIPTVLPHRHHRLRSRRRPHVRDWPRLPRKENLSFHFFSWKCSLHTRETQLVGTN